jgi:hypothetical protein
LIIMATAAILNLFNPSKAATHYGGYSLKVSWSLMKGIQKQFKFPLCCFHCLSRSTRCECCSYQVSSISVWRVINPAVAMIIKVQKMLNSLQTADPFESWHKNRSSLKVVPFVFKIFQMAANIKI